MYHPVASVAKDLCLRHNILTVVHALAFPLPVTAAAFIAVHQTKSNTGKYNQELENRINRRLCLGIAATSVWTAAAVFWGPIFSVGYDLFSDSIRYGCAAVHVTTAALFISLWRQHRGVSFSGIIRGCVGSMFSILAPKMAEGTGRLDNSKANDSALFSASSLGLLLLAITPQLVKFPHATIPTLLGKRLSRTASGFTFLGAVSAHCLQDAAECNVGSNNNAAIKILRRGLAVGSIAHLGLVAAKIIGVDGGGLIIPGRGLWELYPSLVNASGAATFLMFTTFSILGFACTQ